MPSPSQVSSSQTVAQNRIAILLPCYNEAATIGSVVESFHQALPSAIIYVYDNNSTDKTKEIAQAAGATVRTETKQGKGNVVRRMFADIDADTCLMADGDGTYDVEKAPELVESMVLGNYDMVVGSRAAEDHLASSRFGHRAGNELLTRAVAMIFGHGFTDMLSGYRVFSRRFVKSFPACSSGFEIETEITIHALQLGLPVLEIETRYFDRPEGSTSKLNTYRDGLRILGTIIMLFKDIRPLLFFGICFLLLVALSVILAVPIISTFMDTGLVPRHPTAVLATGTMLLGFLNLGWGIILDSVSRGRLEMKKLHYLSICNDSAPSSPISNTP